VKRKLFLLISLLILQSCDDEGNDVEIEISVPVSVEEIKLKSIEEFITTTSTVNAKKEVVLKSETNGYYRLAANPRTRRPFALGDLVRKDEVLVHLENPELENNTKIESQILNLDISEREYEKQKSLYEKGGVTLRELKNAERTYIDAKYNYDNAVIQLSKLKVQVPFNGIIVDLSYYTIDTKVDANQRLAQIMDYSKLYMDINLPAKELGRLKVNQPVQVTNYTLPDDTLRGKITQISRRNCSIFLYGRYSLNSCSIRLPIPGMLSMSSSLAVFRLIGTKTYCSRRATSSSSTYLPISRLNWASARYGRYSSNSCAMRFPTPGTRRISSRLDVFRLIGINNLT